MDIFTLLGEIYFSPPTQKLASNNLFLFRAETYRSWSMLFVQLRWSPSLQFGPYGYFFFLSSQLWRICFLICLIKPWHLCIYLLNKKKKKVA